MTQSPSRRSKRGLRAPLLGLLIATGALVVTAHDGKELSASKGSKLGPDADGDGLADVQEFLLGTNPDQRDTDGDGFHDIEEVARHSDPLLASSTPLQSELEVAQYSYLEDSFLNMHTAIYVEGGNTDNLAFEFGLILNGVPIPVTQSSLLRGGTKAFLYKGLNDPADVLLVLEMPIPEDTALRRGTFHTYGKLVDEDPVAPRSPAADTSAIFDVDGALMEVTTSPYSVQGGTGIVYRPLTGEGAVPVNTVGGQVCWQDIQAVGSNGSSLVYEVQQADCQEFDSFCNTSACSASVGGVLELPDPGSLLGG